MSLQLTFMKVLAGHPEGRASIADLKRCVAILTTSGADWSQRMKRLAARAPGLDIFTSGYVARDASGWQITDLGRSFLISIEEPAPELAIEIAAMIEPIPTSEPLLPGVQRSNVFCFVDHVNKRRGRAAA